MSAAQIKTDQPANAVPTPGAVLRVSRLQNGWDESDVADSLHLSVSQIRAIEGDDYSKLPSKTYVIGYWKNYAKLLQIDIDDIIEANEGQVLSHSPELRIDARHRDLRRRHDSSRRHVAIIALLILLAFLGYVWYSSEQQQGWFANQEVADSGSQSPLDLSLEQDDPQLVDQEIAGITELGDVSAIANTAQNTAHNAANTNNGVSRLAAGNLTLGESIPNNQQIIAEVNQILASPASTEIDGGLNGVLLNPDPNNLTTTGLAGNATDTSVGTTNDAVILGTVTGNQPSALNGQVNTQQVVTSSQASSSLASITNQANQQTLTEATSDATIAIDEQVIDEQVIDEQVIDEQVIDEQAIDGQAIDGQAKATSDATSAINSQTEPAQDLAAQIEFAPLSLSTDISRSNDGDNSQGAVGVAVLQQPSFPAEAPSTPINSVEEGEAQINNQTTNTSSSSIANAAANNTATSNSIDAQNVQAGIVAKPIAIAVGEIDPRTGLRHYMANNVDFYVTGTQRNMQSAARTISFKVDSTTWVDVTDAVGQRVVFRNVRGGERLSADGVPPFAVFVQPANAVSISYLNHQIPFVANDDGENARLLVGTSQR